MNMKKIVGITLGLLVFTITACLLLPADTDQRITRAEAAAYYGSDNAIPDFPETGVKGTDNNPFIILEIVPYEGYAEIGYMIDGCEPVPINKMIFDSSVGGAIASTNGLTNEWKEEYCDVLPEGDVVGSAPGNWEYMSWLGKYRRYRNYFTSKDSFLKYTLKVPDDQLDHYKIQVITVTPDKLNDPAHYNLINRADLIYLSPKPHCGSSLITIWETYHPEKKIENEPQNFYSNDLTWETTLKLLEKAIDCNDPAPIIFDVTTFSTDLSYSGNITVAKYYSNGTPATGLSATGYTSNAAKLYLAMQQMEPGKFYNEFIKTGRIKSVKLKDTSGNPMIHNGISMTTGYFMDLAEDSLPGYYTKKTEDDAAVWNIHTFLPYHLFANYEALNGNKVFESLGYRIFTYDGDQTHRSVRHGLYAYNGDNSITQIFLNNNISENYYNKEAFDYYEQLYGARPVSIKPAEAIYYLLHSRSIYTQTSLRILEIEPCSDFIWDGSQEYWNPQKTPAQDSNNGSDFARQYFCKFFPRFSGKVKITTMTSSEFIGKTEDLNSKYDMVFIGLRDGILRKNSSGTTIYNDSSLNGKIYLHVGDKIMEQSLLRGSFGVDDVTDEYRCSGNDITALKKKELDAFISAGYPVVMGNGFLTDSGMINEAKIDPISQIYKFATTSSENLFFADKLNVTRLEQTLAITKCRIVFGKTDGSLDEKSCYPIVYKDKTKDSSLTDKDIYINGESIGYRTLQYKFYIEDNSKIDTTYEVSLSLDGNADGKFDSIMKNTGSFNIMQEDGYSVDYTNLKPGVNYTLTYNLDESFFGVLPWKLEIKDKANPKHRYSVINCSGLKAEEAQKLHLNILQIMPDSGNNINLADNNLFRIYTENLNDYVLHIKTIKVSEFESLCGNGAYAYLLKDTNEIKNNIKNAAGVYEWDDYDHDNRFDVDILILGFAHMYSDIENQNALNNIKEYIDKGNTVIFTHDITSYVNTSAAKYSGSDYWGYQLNKKFRDLFGMDRFGVSSYSNVADRLAAGKDYAPNGFIQGFTDTILNQYAKTGQYLSNINFPLDMNTTGKYVTNVNKGQLSKYPYQIDDRFRIAATHSQFYQLDMENDDISVWYCLSDDSTDAKGKANGIYSTTQNDVRNNYYIYNKGNITYSGMGHSAIVQDINDAGAVMETKLFINTVIAAYAASVKEPVINITNTNKSTDSSGMDYVYVDYDIYATTKAYGSQINASGQKISYQVMDNNIMDHKKLTVEYYKIDPVTGNEILLTLDTKLEGSDITVSELQNGTKYDIRIPLEKLDTENRGNTIIIRVLLTYGESLTNTITVDKKFTLVRRGLFDLD